MPRKDGYPLISEPAGPFDRKPTKEKLEFAATLRSAMTPAERELMIEMERAKLPKHVSQRVILGYIVDFYFYDAMLVVEVDGGYHDDPAQQAKDAARQEALELAGLTVLRFTNAEVASDVKDVVRRIARRLGTSPRYSDKPAKAATQRVPVPVLSGRTSGGSPVRMTRPTAAMLAEGMARAIEEAHDGTHVEGDYCPMCVSLLAYRSVYRPASEVFGRR